MGAFTGERHEELGIHLETTGWISVDHGNPAANALGKELGVPGAVQRIAEVNAAAIAAQNNLDDLTRLFDLALTTPSIERFRTALEQWARVDGERQALLLILQTRFQDPVPADIAAAVSELNDVVELDRWVRAASTAESIDALRSTLGR